MADGTASAVSRIVAVLGRRDAEQDLGELAAPGADEPGEADDLARAHGQADVPGHRPPDEIARLEHRRADRHGGLGKKALDAPPDHHLDEFGRVGLRHRARSDIGAVAQHRDAVGDLEQLVEPMADVDDPDAAAFELADDVEQARDVALGQRGGRLVHDQDARVVRQRAQDLDPLAVADGERADDLVGGEVVDLERGEQRLGLRPHGAPVDPAAAGARRMAEEDVLGDGEFGKEQQLLIDGRDPGALGFLGRGEARRAPVDQDLAGVRLIDAGDDLDQRRLARAVLAEQRVNLAGADVERDAAQRAHAGKALLEVAHLEQRGGRRRRRAHAASVACDSGSTTTVRTPASASMPSASGAAPESVISVWMR